jgi:sulfatase modifying factor 1
VSPKAFFAMKTAFILLILLTFAPVMPAPAGDIVALCIGNDAYVTPEDVLDTPVNDARLMFATLRAVPGVAEDDIVLVENAKRSEITLALRQLKARAAGAKLVLIFYSGHGVEDTPTGYDRAETFLLPVDAVIESADDLPDKAVPLKTVLEALEGTRGVARGVILDCCRSGAPGATKALARAGKNLAALDESVKKALGGAILPEGTLIAFAASPGRKAAAFLQDTDTNSPFTRFIAEQMSTQGGDLFAIVNAASRITKQRTEMRQVPHVELRGDASLITDFALTAARPVKFTNPAPPGTTPAMTEAEIERRARELAARMVPSTPPSDSPGVSSDSPSSGSVLDQGAVGKAIQVKLPGDVVMKFGYCPAGSFMMGSPASEEDRSDDEDQVQVRISRGFWMGQTEVAQGQWAALMGSNPSNFIGNDMPVETVSWEEAQAFITKLNQSVPLPAGWKYALPTEAQWEYACRAGTESVFSFGDVLNGREANCNGEFPYGTSTKGPSLQKTVKVGSYAANAWGLFDMHGNVYEWCEDAWDGSSKLPGGTDPLGTAGSYRVLRGGSWCNGAQICRAAIRDWLAPDSRVFYLGFRVAAVPAGAR